MTTSWLPQLECLTKYNGDWTVYLDAIYSFFHADFVASRPSFKGTPLALKRHPVIEDKEATFWHITSQGDVEEERTPCMRRCERIRWPRPTIENCDDTGVKIWSEFRNGENKIHIWLESESYLVVLNERKGYTLLWTAIYIEREHQRTKLNNRYLKHK